MTRRMTFIVIILILASFELGMIIGDKVGSKGGSSNGSYAEGWNAAKKRLSESGFLPAMMNNNIKSVTGQIADIKGSDISLKIRPLEPLADPALDIRIVKADANTKIYKLVQKDQETYQKEIMQYSKAMQDSMKNPATTTASTLTPPTMFTKTDAQLSDLKANQQLMVTAEANIAEAREFKATEIDIQAATPLPPTTPPVVAPK